MASLGQLAAGVAHEINNPLTGIIFYADLLLDSLEQEDPRRHSLSRICEDARRCGKIIKNLLTYSRQETSSKEILHVNTLLEHSLDLIRDPKVFTGPHQKRAFRGYDPDQRGPGPTEPGHRQSRS